jgi:methylglutaconyl-CoA hydratase
MTSSADLVLSTTDERGVVTLTLNRPVKGNAYNRVVLDRLETELARIAADPGVRVVVLRGAGRHFCVGGDIFGDPQAHIGDESPTPRTMLPGICFELDRLGKPTIAAVHGACFGGGFALAACCDILLATSDAFFSVPELRLGFAPGPVAPYFLRGLGPRHLRRYLISGERFSAADGLRMGLVHEICEPGECERVLTTLIDNVLLSAPHAVAVTKARLQHLAWTPPTRELLAELQVEFRRGFESEEGIEGRASFQEKRKPAWAPKS